jgi:hypothetical protein
MKREEFARQDFLRRVREELKRTYLLTTLQNWNAIISKPIKFPNPSRRRREDREIPKAA